MLFILCPFSTVPLECLKYPFTTFPAQKLKCLSCKFVWNKKYTTFDTDTFNQFVSKKGHNSQKAKFVKCSNPTI